MFKIKSVRIVAALLIILIESGLSKEIWLRIWSCRTVSGLECEELVDITDITWL